MKKHTILLLFVCTCFSPRVRADFTLDELAAALDHDPSNKTLLIDVCKRFHRKLASHPAGTDWKKAEKYFELLNKQFRIHDRLRRGALADPLATAIYSSFKVLRGIRLARKKNPLTRYYVNTYMLGEGTADLDRAVEAEPSNVELRLVRALNGYASSRRGRMALVIEDFKFVIGMCESDPDLGAKLEVPKIYLMLAECARRHENYLLAREVLVRLRKKHPQSSETTEATKRLIQIEPYARKQRQYLEKLEMESRKGKKE